MQKLPQLRVDGEVHPVDLADLDEDIRQGRVLADAELSYAPWTGEDFVPLGALPQLAEAFESPNAGFVRHLLRGPLPWASTAVTAVVLAAGLLQIGLMIVGGAFRAQALWVLNLYGRSAVGFEPLLFDGAWWSPWGSQLVHSGPTHLFPNLAVLGYAGYRVERALGPTGYAVVAAAALLGGVAAVTILQPIPVVGSSILGFGLWGAQLAIGFRMGDTMPSRHRAFYGYGNLAIFVVLFAGTLAGENVSHYAHVGGFAGGALAAVLVKPPFMFPATARARVRTRLWGLAAALAIAPSFLGPVLRHVPWVAYWPPQEVDLVDVGATVTVPGRLLPEDGERAYTMTARGMPAWNISRRDLTFVFCGLDRLRWDQVEGGDPLTGEALARYWSSVEGDAHAIEAPPPRAPGWTAHALEFVDEDGTPKFRLVEHHLLRGRYLNRVGYVVNVDEGGASGPREPLYRSIAASVRVGEPPDLAKAREQHARSPTSPRIRLELARALWDLGDLVQADAIYALVVDTPSPQQSKAVSERLSMWASHPDAFADAPDPPWFEQWMVDLNHDRQLQVDGIHWLSAEGRCAVARVHHQRFAEERPDAAELVTTAEAVLRCEGAL
ncbi:MAG: rhomboid family intramembrane serine protease [Alphaproteobacteria bacterium]|nr:rhomboid family intramembrane serine protease [Alphaproteobacteria bacterium]